jgi:N-acetylneuraminic acid mutarotase
LVVGGEDAEMLNPGTAQWESAGRPGGPLQGHTATLLRDGRVLVVGGTTQAEVQLFTPDTFGPGVWQILAQRDARRTGHTATLLADGSVLVVGGTQRRGAETVAATTELFDPTFGTLTPVASPRRPRNRHTATLIAPDEVLVAGGPGAPQAEIFSATTGSWRDAGALAEDHSSHAAVALLDGRVVVIAGERSVPGVGLAREVSATVEIRGDGR